ncbi:hypothetical protein MA05_11415 [Comamonas aquatica]|uniref:hypothetical protein n=1 Tax=Comamonas aquatica TaxID=225991 RepID=UPI0005ED1973|nr:hypothetical protein [Comamonas aquatica]ANY62585.1 hypothetical protein MA05_11415 [Comamonas aquatica]
MARPANHQREEAISLLRSLTAQHGAKEGTRLAREQFPDVPAGTWGRWRQMAVGTAANADAQALNSLTDEVRRTIPRPEALTAGPVLATRRALDFWAMLDELEHDARLMRDFALTRGADGAVKVRVPFALRDAHRMRCDLIRLALQQAEVAWSTERAATFFKTIIDEISAESPDCQRRIMERLHAVQGERAQRGF